ncbi:MAG: acetate--CoA ligase family protein [Oscillospiraceae bacterium]|jgi:acyl-CoA synthetase (NDP forming)|nr:acetate--CoA ligase family protein [Oscillospiraceae bacterium]
MHTLADILLARSIAVVGASANPEKMGYVILNNLIQGGYAGALYPVNLKEQIILGLPCIPSVADIPGELDLVVVCVPAAHAASVLRQAGAKGAKGAIIISGGFGEIGNYDRAVELTDAAKAYGMRVIGPNCQGVNYTANRMCATWPLVKSPGAIGIVSQSGTIGAEIELLAERDGIGVSCFAALGNKSDIDEADFIDFFVSDPHTKVIALNIEGIGDPERFIPAITRAARIKPVVALKPGRTEKGMRAVASHTSSIAGNDRLFTAFCRKYGIIRADDLTEFYDFCKAAALSKTPMGPRVLIISSSGGAGILSADAADEAGLDIRAISGETIARLGQALPSQCVLANPLDLTGDATASRYEAAFDALGGNSEFDVILAIFGDPIAGACKVIQRQLSVASMPVVVSFLGGGDVQLRETALMHQNGIAVYPTPERAVKAIGALVRLRLAAARRERKMVI